MANRFRFTVLGRYESRVRGNASHLTVAMAAGPQGHFVYCGTLTMSESEWGTFIEALRASLGDGVEVMDPEADERQPGA